jgi:Na+-driven multidrug efflux pump
LNTPASSTAPAAAEAGTGSATELTPGAPAATSVAPPGTARSRRFDRSIVEGPIARAVWKLAWPTVLQNAIGGLQGIIDHAMVGHFVGYTANAAIGVSWQIFLVVIVFIASLFTGMGVLVARFAGANDHERVDRTVYQAFLVAVVLAVGIMAPIGYFAAPALLRLVNATPEVSAQALPYLRTMFLFSIGMLLFFMLGGALRAAGDARTPLRLGVCLTALNLTLNIILIRGLGPIPALGIDCVRSVLHELISFLRCFVRARACRGRSFSGASPARNRANRLRVGCRPSTTSESSSDISPRRAWRSRQPSGVMR